jgi:hypothetical protein
LPQISQISQTKIVSLRANLFSKTALSNLNSVHLVKSVSKTTNK